MLIFNCTKATVDFFTVTRRRKKISLMSPSPEKMISDLNTLHDNEQWHWMIHTVKLNRKNVLVAMDTDTRFFMLFWGLRKGDVNGFIEQFHIRMVMHINLLMKIGDICQSTIDNSLTNYLEHHSKIAFVQRGDRSVQAHINDVTAILGYEYDLWNRMPNEEDIFQFDLRHNEILRKRKQDKDYIFPNYEFFHSWLVHYAHMEKLVLERTVDQYNNARSELRRLKYDYVNVEDIYW